MSGRYRLAMQHPEQEHPYVVGGVYREVTPPKRLAFTWTWEKRPGDDPDWTPAETLVTLDFIDRDGATKLALTHERFPDTHMRDEHNSGWTGCSSTWLWPPSESMAANMARKSTASNATIMS